MFLSYLEFLRALFSARCYSSSTLMTSRRMKPQLPGFLRMTALLNRKFHISQISHRVKNWYQNVTFGKYEVCVLSISINLGGLTSVLKFHIFLIFNCDELVRIRVICEGLVRFFSDVNIWYSIFTINVKNRYQFFKPGYRNKLLTQKLLKQGYRYHKLRKTFSKFYRRYYDLISKFQVGLKSLLRQGLSEPDFYGDLVYKLKRIVGSNNFSAQFIKIISHYKKIGYNINVLQQTACLVVNPITVGNFAFLFNCTPVGRTSDSMMVPT